MASKAFESATEFFNALNAAATTESVNGKDVRVFRGSIVKVFRSLSISQSYYSEVRLGLINSECISIVQQGARGLQSIVVLHRQPDMDSFESAKNSVLTKGTDTAILSQQVEDLKRLIGSVSVPEALMFLEQKNKELTNRVIKLEQLLIQKKREIN